MKTFRILVIFTLLGGTAFAQKSPKESALVWLGVHEQVEAANQYQIEIQQMSYSGPLAPLYNAWFTNYAGLSTPVQSPNVSFQVFPGQEYVMTTSCSSWNGPDIQFNVPPGYTLYMGPAYMPMLPHTTIAAPNGNPAFTVFFYVMPNDGAAWLSPGFATSPHVSDITWAVSTGTLADGMFAGAFRWRATSVSSALLDPENLIYTPTSTTANVTSLGYVPPANVIGTYYYAAPGSGYPMAIMYVSTLEAQYFIRGTPGSATGYTIEVYSPGVAYSWPSGESSGNWTFTSAPNIKYTISAGSGGAVQIAQYVASSGLTTTWTLSQSGGTTSVTQTNSGPTGNSRIINLVSTTSGSTRQENITIEDGSSVVAEYKQRNYQTFAWGEEMVSEIDDPTALDPSGVNYTTTYTYYQTTVGDGEYSKLQSVTNPDGSWVQYDYYTDFARWGELKYVYTPFVNSPGGASGATTTNCRLVTYNYAPERTVYSELNAGTVTTIKGHQAGQETVTPSLWTSTVYNLAPIGNQPMRTDTIQDYSASGVCQTTVRKVFHNEADLTYSGKLYSQVNPDGTMESVSYWTGTCSSWLTSTTSYNSTAFTPVSGGNTWVENHLYGTVASAGSSSVLFSNDGVTGGNAVDPIYLTPYKSYRRQIQRDTNGNPLYDVMEVYTGSGFQIISWTVSSYDWQGLIATYQKSTGETWSCLRENGKISFEYKPDGTHVAYTFDSLMRTIQVQQNGAAASGSYPAQTALQTNYTYDAAGHVLTTTTEPSGGALTLTKTNTYNYAGMLTSQTDEKSLTTNYYYTFGGRFVNIYYPNGSSLSKGRYLDGTPYEAVGNAQVSTWIVPSVNSDGTTTEIDYTGVSGGSRKETIQRDWLGRTISDMVPAYGGLTSTKTYSYNTLGQLIETTQTGQSPTYYQYDGLGHLQYTWLDYNHNGTLDLGGPDRVTENLSQVLVDSNNIWWNQTQTYVFTQGSSTPTLKSDVRQRLVPYGSTQTDFSNGVAITETDSYDYYGNLTKEIVNSGYNTAITTDTTTLPNSTVPKVSTKYNRLVESTQTAQGIVTTYQYDGLDRETSEVDPRKGTSYTAYYASGYGQDGQVSSKTDAAGNATSFTYGTDGRLFSQTDAQGNTIYHGYDYAGREVQTWGTGTFPVEVAYDDTYGQKIAMRTFRSSSINFGTSAWPMSDDGGDPMDPQPSSWANGDTTTWTYDTASGVLTSKTDAASKSVSYTYNPNGSVNTRTWARGVVTTYSYDAYSAELTGVSYSDGVTPGITYVYDRLGHKTSVVETLPSSSTITTGLQYNVPGKLTQENLDSTYFAGRQLVYQLDTTNTGTLGRTIGYTLGTSGSPTSEQGVSYNYDSTGRLDYVGYSGLPAFTYSYTPNSNLIGSVTDAADNWTQARTWDAHRDLLGEVKTSVGSTVEGDFSYQFDTLGRRSSKLEAGALFARYPAAGLVEAFSYDSKSEVTGDQVYHSTNPTSPSNPVVGRGFAYQYDPIGNRTTSAIDSTYTTTYTSNSLNQISTRAVPGNLAVSGLAPSGATVTLNGTAIPTGDFDGQYYLENLSVSNSSSPQWLTESLSSSLGGSMTANAFVPQTPETSVYDADGNLLSDGRWNYGWDGENHLAWMETYGNQPGNSTVVWNCGITRIHLQFWYDQLGRRISKVTSSWSGSSWVPYVGTRYIYSRWNLIADYNYNVTSGVITPTDTYLWGIDLSGKIHGAGGVGGLLAWTSLATASVEMPIYDGNGNVQGLSDRSSGQITAAYEYSPYGELLRATGVYAQLNPFQFSTKYTDPETGLVYYGRRYYNPTLGRFIGRDPAKEDGGLNLYAFCANNGLNAYDVNGLAGGGLTVVGSFEYGAWSAWSGGGTGSVSFGGFTGNGGNVPPSNGLFLSGGLFGSQTGTSTSLPNNGQSPGAAGFSVGAGPGIFLTNANSANDLSGAFNQVNVNVFFLSGSYSWGTNSSGNFIGVGSLSFTPVGPGGISVSAYPTNTAVLGTINWTGGNAQQPSVPPPNTPYPDQPTSSTESPSQISQPDGTPPPTVPGTFPGYSSGNDNSSGNNSESGGGSSMNSTTTTGDSDSNNPFDINTTCLGSPPASSSTSSSSSSDTDDDSSDSGVGIIASQGAVDSHSWAGPHYKK